MKVFNMQWDLIWLQIVLLETKIIEITTPIAMYLDNGAPHISVCKEEQVPKDK